MIAMALVLLAWSDPPVMLSAVRIEAENDRPVVRAVLSAGVPARVDREGKDVVLVLPGARAAASLRLPEPVAEIQSLTVEPMREGVRIRIRLEKVLEYILTQEAGTVSVSLVASPTAASSRAAGEVRDLYAKLVPPPSGAASGEQPAPAGEGAADRTRETDGLHFGLLRVVPSVAVSYIDADTALLDTPSPVRDKYFQVEPRLACDLGAQTPGSLRFQLTYAPRFRMRSSFAELRHATHLVNVSLDAPIGPTITLRASHHYANGVLETTEVDPGREYFFRLAPFTRNQTMGGVVFNSGGLVGLEISATRDSVRLADEAGFFSHRTDSAAGNLNYQLGPAARAYLRYQWDHVPPAPDRPIVESRASTVSLGLSGDLLPLVTGEASVGYSHLSAPRGVGGGTSFDGMVFVASLRKQFTPAASLTLVGRRGTYPSGFEQNAFYVATGAGVEADLGLPLSLVFHGGVGWQRNGYRVPAAGSSVPRKDDITSWSAGVGRSLTRWSFLRADYRGDQRDSNLPAFDSNGHVLIVQVGLGYLGGSPAGGGAR